MPAIMPDVVDVASVAALNGVFASPHDELIDVRCAVVQGTILDDLVGTYRATVRISLPHPCSYSYPLHRDGSNPDTRR
jgi:hypothetical protein